MCSADLHLDVWQRDVISKMLDTGHAELVLRIHPAAGGGGSGLLDKLKSPHRLLFSVYNRFWVDKKAPCRHSVNAASLLEPLPDITVAPELKGKFSQYFRADDCAAIAAHAPDILLRFDFGIIRGDILEIPTYGVWSYHHGDPRKFRGSPPAFWETYTNYPTVGVVLQRLTDSLDDGLMLRFGQVARENSYPQTIQAQYTSSTWFAASVCNGIVAGRESCNRSCIDMQKEGKGPIYRPPSITELLMFGARSLYSQLSQFFFKVLHVDTWSVAVVRKDLVQLLEQGLVDGDDIEWFDLASIQADDMQYVADPFAYRTDERLHVLVEKYSYARGIGDISALVFEKGRFSDTVSTVLDKPWHLSYPHISADHSPDHYQLMPEMSECLPQVTYRCRKGENTAVAEFPHDIPASIVDPTLLEYGGKHWLFCTEPGARANDTLFDFLQG